MKSKAASLLRWPVLILACVMFLGSYYSFDIPSALKKQLGQYLGEEDNYETMFSLLYTLYAAPNIILPLFGGFFVDYVGVRFSLLTFTLCIALGQIIFTFGLIHKSWSFLLLGRFVFGLGGESLNVAISALIADWFQGREVAFAFGVNLSLSRIGSILNNILSPYLSSTYTINIASWMGFVLCIVSVMAVLITYPIDQAFDNFREQEYSTIQESLETAESRIIALDHMFQDIHYKYGSEYHHYNNTNVTTIEHSSSSSSSSSTTHHSNSVLQAHVYDPNPISITSVTRRRSPNVTSFQNGDTYNLITGEVTHHSPRNTCSNNHHTNATSTTNAPAVRNSTEPYQDTNVNTSSSYIAVKKTSHYHQLTSFPFIFWVLIVLTCSIYGAVIPFNNVASSLLLERNYFKSPPSSCTLLDPYSCQSDTNIPNPTTCSIYYQYSVDIKNTRMYIEDSVSIGDSRTSLRAEDISYRSSELFYHPPLPKDITIHNKYYSQLTTKDIDCAETVWSEGCTSIYCTMLDKAEKKAAYIMSIPYLISVLVSPPLGLWIDYYGRRADISLLSCVLVILSHSILAYTTINVKLPLIGQGLVYTGFASVIWPTIPLVIDEHQTGLGFGLVTCAYNFACSVVPLIVASVHDTYDSYIPSVEWIFITLGIIGTIAGIYCSYYDHHHNHILNRGSTD